MIFEGSRYQGGTVYTMPDRLGSSQVTVERAPAGDPGPTQGVVIPEGARLDIVALRLYGDETLWWVIADVNPGLMWFDEIPVGTVLKVPRGPVR